jgi:asparagine synthase (glutamine-hydrolysing)
MCGINGVIHQKKKSIEELKMEINSMNDLIIHRGPDDDGVFTFNESSDFSLAMGMRRLSIIDLNSGKQPIFSDDKKIVIVFNGEIYNYKVLKRELEEKGVKFNTKSDTEVILKLYETYGVSSFKKLDGMFGFSIFDLNKNKVYIARDYFGEKPLYYTKVNDKFIWASELKGLMKSLNSKPSINKTGLNLFFRLTYIPAPYTIYDDVHKLEPNHFLTYDLTNGELTSEIISENLPINKIDISFDDAKKKVRELVKESVESRAVSDVPVGTFLSGGVDSSIVSLCLSNLSQKKINTFSIGFDKKSFDESDKAREVAKMINSNHYEFVLNESDLENNIDEILLNFDEPFADSSSLPSYLVANKTSEHVKVALTGDGGDEVFGGYNKYYMGEINQKYTRLVPKIAHNAIKNVASPFLKTKTDNRGKKFKIKRLLNAIDYSNNYYWDIISLGFSSNSLENYLLPEYYSPNQFDHYKSVSGIECPTNLSEYRTIDKYLSLEGDMLVKVDRTSMLNSLECRAPFLNKKLWDYTNSLPEEYLMNKFDKKHILKKAFENDFSEGFLDKSKSGFGIPIGDWLRSSLKLELQKYIDRDFLTKQDIFKPEEMINLVNNHLLGVDNTFKVWTFFCFQKWYQNNYDV